ncbi:hypothetical protein WJX72_005450 [[Myrmecia] bisecta]|uniref:Kinesin motor domain-containing protein n=1 Tax=[Myrmecia] bisecta TaxID=41462 RepID=A0AAW1PJU9_9CHLO
MDTLSQIQVKSTAELAQLLSTARNAQQASTADRKGTADRSGQTMPMHLVLRITVEQAGAGKTMRSHLDFVDLGAPSMPGSRAQSVSSTAASLEALAKVLAAFSQGKPASASLLQGQPAPLLVRVLSDSLSDDSRASLIATINPSRDCCEDTLSTLRFASKCCGHESTTPSTSRRDTPRQGNTLAQDSSAPQRLEAENAYLKAELERTHAHYQKLIERIGGPSYRSDMGPLETDLENEGGPAGGLLADQARPRSRHGTASPAESNGSAADQGGDSSASSPQGAATGTRRTSDRLHDGAKTGVQALKMANMTEKQKRHFEALMEANKIKMRDLEMRLESKSEELAVVRERMMTSEHRSFQQVKKLTAQISDVKHQEADAKAMHAAKMEEVEGRCAEAVGEAQRKVDDMRRQMQAMAESIPDLIRARTAEASDRKALERQLQKAMDEQLAEQLRVAKERHTAELEAVKQELSLTSLKKGQELSKLRGEFDKLKQSSSADIQTLSEELWHLYDYCQQVEGLMHKMQTGQFRVSLYAGLRTIKVPARERLTAPDMERVKRLVASVASTKKLEVKQQALTSGHRMSENGSLQNSLSVDGQSMRSGNARQLEARVGELQAKLSQYESEEAAGELRKRIEQQYRAELEGQLLLELQAHPTVEYIRQLEEDNLKYRKSVQDAEKRNQNMAVVIKSLQRTEEKEALQRQQRAASPLLRPPSVGASLNSTLPSRPGSSLGFCPANMRRPETAAASMGSMRRPMTPLMDGRGAVPSINRIRPMTASGAGPDGFPILESSVHSMRKGSTSH